MEALIFVPIRDGGDDGSLIDAGSFLASLMTVMTPSHNNNNNNNNYGTVCPDARKSVLRGSLASSSTLVDTCAPPDSLSSPKKPHSE